jgi:hypothetical protein
MLPTLGYIKLERPLHKGKPVFRPVIKPLSPSQDHSASHSASLSLSQSQGQSLSQTCVADSLTQKQRAVLSYLIETRPDIVSFAQLGEAVGLREATTRTILRRLAVLDFINFERARDGQIQGVRINFNESRCKRFTQGHSLDQSSSQPVSKPLTSKKIDLKEEIYLSKDELGEMLLHLSDELFAQQWPDLPVIGFGTNQIRQVVESRRAVGKPNSHLVEALDHANFELRDHRERHKELLDQYGKPVDNKANYVFRALCNTGYYRRPLAYVSPAEQKEIDAETEARQVVEAHKKREEAEFQAWCCRLTQEERDAILHEGPAAPDHIKLNSAWRKSREKAQRTGIDESNPPQANPHET